MENDNQPNLGASINSKGVAPQTNRVQSSTKKKLDIKTPVTRIAIGLLAAGAIFVVLAYTNIITFSQFKTVDFTSSGDTHYSLTFYSNHTTKTLESGNSSLVSRESVDGKYPLTLSISSAPAGDIEKNGIKTCSGSLPKAFDVQNSNLNQQISVCAVPSDNNGPVGVYIMGFVAEGKDHVVTISQDLSGVDLSSQSSAQQSVLRFGLDAYDDDIKTIVSSIKIE